MKAMVYRRYGEPRDVLEPAEVPEPKVGPESVLVAVAAAGVNPVDWQTMAGHLDTRFDVLFPVVPGWDFAGTVVRVGPNVTRFAPGDAVFGYARQDIVHHGTYAERIAVPERAVAHKPATLDWTRAAATPIAALTAWQALVDVLDVHPGDTVLVQAAAGGVGSFATQIARHLGARVVGTASPANHETLAAAGVIPVDRHGDLAAELRRAVPGGVDAVLDMYGGSAVRLHADLLRPTRGHKRIVSLADDGVRDLGGRFLFAQPDAGELHDIADLIDRGALHVPNVRTRPLAEAAHALADSAGGMTQGKIVLTVREPAEDARGADS
ncbi:NADP-dependent oxidoreductase [Brooklawnia cerclae]|uniref:NADPH:quinone reductase-like Zn-dependent oxidoreductase n=1 Tax=Brooklawnia cerclae TaxID=349934 RepID=A0ABX0SIM5_9ACTN|nr:NADP-dependent oxidoreductase [Brooklawnia cerclae]NIH57826.1 NADPH:quinone reductase-like Zn-dependent oxidoreductase [Brooklawnia cerclae]